MGRSIRYEVCVEDVEGALAAERGGADRVELCAGLSEGGTTPSVGALAEAVERLGIPVVALLRPRPGDFVYTAAELAVLRRDVDAAREAGATAVALGVSHGDGSVDVDRTRELVERARPMQVTFHRAFDLVPDLRAGIDDLLRLGVERVLTSGGAPEALAGKERLRTAVELAGERLIVLAGGGVRAANVLALVESTGVREVHGSAWRTAYGRRVTDEALVRGLVDRLRWDG